MRLLLLAPPGAGKGTQGVRLAAKLGVRHVPSGELLREQVRRGTPLGAQAAGYLDRGELVPDALVLELLRPVLAEAAAGGGYVLDGFPRNLAQAEQSSVPLDAVVFLRVRTEELVRRLLHRARQQGRSDDNEEVIRRRLDLYHGETAPLADYYRSRNLLVEVDGERPMDEVTDQIVAALSGR